jgi:hypothetical protein
MKAFPGFPSRRLAPRFGFEDGENGREIRTK